MGRINLVVSYDQQSGMIYDRSDFCFATFVGLEGQCDVASESVVSGTGVEELIKLRNAGYTTDEIIELRRKELI